MVRVLPFCGRSTRFYESTDDATETAQRNGCLQCEYMYNTRRTYQQLLSYFWFHGDFNGHPDFQKSRKIFAFA